MCVRAGIYDQTENSAVIKALPCIFFKGKEGKSLFFCPLVKTQLDPHFLLLATQAYSLTLSHRKEINKNKNRKKKNVAKNVKTIVKVIKKD